MIRRKGVDVLIEAFVRSRLVHAGWRLLMFGSGPLSRLARGEPGIFHQEFSPPEVIAKAVGSARIFAMPSRDDNWPLALHEGTAAGCLLLTTTAVGSHSEFVGPENGMVVNPGVVEELCTALLHLAALNDTQLDDAEARSVAKAGHFGPASFARVFERICRTFANLPAPTPC
jgi:glycosyltransferase involved in cell wall biosynthesis